MRASLLVLVASLAFAAVPKATPPSDAVVEAAIRAKFAKSKISQDQFRVTVKAGVATLEGKTDIPQRKGVATRFARTSGAREVVNKIQVGEAARKKLSDRLQKARAVKTATSGKPGAQTASTDAAPPRRMEIKH